MLHSVLNVFPDLLTYELAGPAILRVALGIIFLDLGYLYLTKEKGRLDNLFGVIGIKPADFFARVYALICVVGGLSLIVGVYTQVSALVFAVFSALEIIIEYREPVFLRRSLVFYVLLFVISVSLLFTGAGFLAFDSHL